MPTIEVMKLHNDVELPAQAHEGDAGFDIKAYCPDTKIILNHGNASAIPTGIAMAIPSGYEIQVRSRSGLALRDGVSVVNSPGTIDSGYRGEIKIIMTTQSEIAHIVNHGDKIAQLVVAPVPQVTLKEVNSLNETERGKNGFGSTGK